MESGISIWWGEVGQDLMLLKVMLVCSCLNSPQNCGALLYVVEGFSLVYVLKK